jgi:hypothetical protein
MTLTEDSIKRIGEGVIARTLPKPEWTHEGHLLAALYWQRHHAGLVRAGKIGDVIRGYNEATGVINDENGGYHETITLAYLRMTAWFLGQFPAAHPLADVAQALLASPYALREWPLEHWQKDTLFSPLARANWVEPDVKPLPF